MLARIASYLISGIIGLFGGFFGAQVIELPTPPLPPPPAPLDAAAEPDAVGGSAPPRQESASAPASAPPPKTASEASQPPRSVPAVPSSPAAPAPLALEPAAAPALGVSAQGILAATNAERATERLPALSLDPALTEMAQRKVADMFEKQYFAHDSPSGVGVEDLANAAGYDFLLVGENLALGNFKTSREIVEAWMESPGHRANILKPQYSEIGIAVGKGKYEGRTVWLAVQEFGLPLSACAMPSAALKATIDRSIAELAALKKDIDGWKAKADDATVGSSQWHDAVESYNDSVEEHNALVDRYRLDVARYNDQVADYNDCLESKT